MGEKEILHQKGRGSKDKVMQKKKAENASVQRREKESKNENRKGVGNRVFQCYHCRFQCSPSLEKLRRYYHIDLSKRYMRVLDEHYGTAKKRSKKNLEKLNQCSSSLEKLRRHYHIDLPKRYMRVLDEHYGIGKKRSKKNLKKLNEYSRCDNLFDKSRLDSHSCNYQLKLGGVAFDPFCYGHNENETLKIPSRNPRDKHKSKLKSKSKPSNPQTQS